LEKKEWRLAAEGKAVPPGHCAFTNLVYDSVGKVCLLWDTKWTKALWAYDPRTVKWTRLAPKGPPPVDFGKEKVGHREGQRLLYYDPERNVTVIPGRWVHRHKKREK
jgi:hypothetical protein